MKEKNLYVRICFYVLGFVIMTMGIAISRRSGLGVSPVSTIPYTITGITGITISIATIIFHAVLVALQFIILRKDFKIKNLLQIPAGILFGLFTGFFQKLANKIIPNPAAFAGGTGIAIAAVMCLISTFLIALGIFFYVPADIVPLAGEGAMLAISQKTGIKFSTVKIAFDVTMVLTSFIACIIYAKGVKAGIGMEIIGAGTVVAAIIVGMELKLITKLFGEKRDRILNKSSNKLAAQN